MIIQKLFEIFKEVHSQKFEMASNGEYKFISSSALKNFINPLLIKHGVMPTPPRVESVTRHNRIIDVIIEFGFVDVEDLSETRMMIVGSGFDDSDKGVYKAMTGADKYKYILLFQIPTQDDPEYGNFKIINQILPTEDHSSKAVGRVMDEIKSIVVNEVPEIPAVKEPIKRTEEVYTISGLGSKSLDELKSMVGQLVDVDSLTTFEGEPVKRMSKRMLADIILAKQRGDLKKHMNNYWGIQLDIEEVKETSMIEPKAVVHNLISDLPEIEDVDPVFRWRSFGNATQIEDYFLSLGFNDDKVIEKLKEMDMFDYGDGEENVYLNLKDVCTSAPTDVINDLLTQLNS